MYTFKNLKSRQKQAFRVDSEIFTIAFKKNIAFRLMSLALQISTSSKSGVDTFDNFQISPLNR